MDIRPVYWALFGAGATLLTSAWGSKQAMLLPQDQDVNIAVVIAKETVGLSQIAASNISLIKRQPWAGAKSDPFAKAVPVKQKTAAPITSKVEAPQPQPPSFPYVFVGRLLAEEKDTVFLSRNNQIYSVMAGDTLDGSYRIERVGGNELEIIYLPDRQKLTISFDALALKPTPKASTMLSQAGTSPNNAFTPHAFSARTAGEPADNVSGQTAENMKQAAPPQESMQGMAGTPAPSALPTGMTGEVPSESNGLMTDDLRQMLVPPPPPEGDALKIMGFTPPPQGDAMQLMGVRPVVDNGSTAAPAAP